MGDVVPLGAHPIKCGVVLRHWEISAGCLVLFIFDLHLNVVNLSQVQTSVEHAVCDGSGHGVDHQRNKQQDQQHDQYLQNQPLVVLPDDVLERLERVHEP